MGGGAVLTTPPQSQSPVIYLSISPCFKAVAVFSGGACAELLYLSQTDKHLLY